MLEIPKQGATPEEINLWIAETKEKYEAMEVDIENKAKREKELIDYNNKLFAKVTSKVDKPSNEKDDTEEIPFVIDEKTAKLLSEKDIAELKELLEDEE